MEKIRINNLSFTYPGRTKKALGSLNLEIGAGEFVTVCGRSGCGKTTLLRLIKPTLAPFGNTEGEIYLGEKQTKDLDTREQASRIGFVMQDPDNQLVCDKVWHELAFGLESLGYSTPQIRTRVSEMASFFGIENWFYKKVTELSGGQKQLLNLASVMAMQPSVIILDEPTSQLDPIAAQEFLSALKRINRELGTSVILSEHRLEEAFAISDRVIVLDEGSVIADAPPADAGKILKSLSHPMYDALPAPMRIFGALDEGGQWPVTVRDGRIRLEEYCRTNGADQTLIPKAKEADLSGETVIELKDVWFRYKRDLPDVIKGLNVRITKGEFFAIVGGNGTGKTTALSLISGINTPHRGEVLIGGRSIGTRDNPYGQFMTALPQNPRSVFVKKTVRLDLMEALDDSSLTDDQKKKRIAATASLCRIDTLLDSHPYDLSGGEQQRAALAKVLLLSPEILLLDEPTKGLDAEFKSVFADIIHSLKSHGVTVVMVSHDIEFCAQYTDRCAMFFDGSITSCGEPREFFALKSFYTTCANRMARGVLPGAILADDVILACGGTVSDKPRDTAKIDFDFGDAPPPPEEPEPKKLSPLRIAAGCVFALLFAIIELAFVTEYDILHLVELCGGNAVVLTIFAFALVVAAFCCFFPQKELGSRTVCDYRSDRKISGRTLLAALLVVLAIPLTIYAGVFYLGDRKYYFISLIIIAETLVPFCMMFENRKPRARELVIISVLCALAVAGRTAFFMLPQFKPVVAIVIIAGVCFGGETGFFVGAVTGFVSNFFFGQGPWTPWQMFALGAIGFLAGVLFANGFLRRTRASLAVFGFVAALVIYGGILNPASVIMMQSVPTWRMIVASYVAGLPLDAVHALSTAFFLWFLSEPMIDKLERTKIKYGLIPKEDIG